MMTRRITLTIAIAILLTIIVGVFLFALTNNPAVLTQ